MRGWHKYASYALTLKRRITLYSKKEKEDLQTLIFQVLKHFWLKQKERKEKLAGAI